MSPARTSSSVRRRGASTSTSVHTGAPLAHRAAGGSGRPDTGDDTVHMAHVTAPPTPSQDADAHDEEEKVLVEEDTVFSLKEKKEPKETKDTGAGRGRSRPNQTDMITYERAFVECCVQIFGTGIALPTHVLCLCEDRPLPVRLVSPQVPPGTRRTKGTRRFWVCSRVGSWSEKGRAWWATHG